MNPSISNWFFWVSGVELIRTPDPETPFRGFWCWVWFGTGEGTPANISGCSREIAEVGRVGAVVASVRQFVGGVAKEYRALALAVEAEASVR